MRVNHETTVVCIIVSWINLINQAKLLFFGYIKIHDPRSLAPLPLNGNRKFEILLVKRFSLKQKRNQIIPATYRKNQIFSLRKQPHVA